LYLHCYEVRRDKKLAGQVSFCAKSKISIPARLRRTYFAKVSERD
jgi:hypothetical protein